MSISADADYDEIRQAIHDWLTAEYPDIKYPGDQPLSQAELIAYYEHCEVALLELNLLDTFPDFLRLIRRTKNYLKRLTPLEYKKEFFRSRTAF